MTDRTRDLLDAVARGEVSPADAERQLAGFRGAAVSDFAVVDHERAARCGAPEVVFCQGKEPDQIVAIASEILDRSPRVLLTRIRPEHAERVLPHLPDAHHHERARCITVDPAPIPPAGLVAVVAAGTADLPVADEAALTAGFLGARTETHADVGVAGLHRLLERLPEIRRAHAVIAVAGMEGALPSVVAGQIDRPVIAVPTSVGYGVSLAGIAPLLTMMSSCAAGIGVVNIDNGFGAGYLAAQINRLATAREP